ncbi:pyridoxal phosphate-dependent aminotransferase [Tropicimonas sp. IMCC6043]|uniref:pyridoxal phosphate-dependent aminotransferase n=1 Tax=Tropicimonas sp. IMCC6043 TaxID=2510645 RepID=UPI00101BB8CE|nr:pyridoxal phosphate-dependent aminotransferase [Tropicimonas sp. IMCC6043]RYH08898.1 pyridoxal phosphate-dependent aminotransferase [Tropicimonas sp. IMCC6043]
MRGPRFTPLATSLPASVPFVGPEAQERARGRRFAARIGANESGFGPAPSVVEAIARAGPDAWMYGDPESHDLTRALAAHLDLPAEAVLVGEGIDGLLGYLVRLLVGPGDAVVTSDGAYPTFNYHVAGFGGTIHKVPFRDDHEDTRALTARAAEVDARIIYLANPDNPMGSWHDAATLAETIQSVPDGCILLLDEAYVEFAPEGTAPLIDISDPRVIRMRTFSKAHGLAGMRVGYAIGHPDLIRAFNKVRNHFGMSRVSQAAALASLADPAYLAGTIARVVVARDRIAAIARANGLAPLPSATNFVTVDCGGDGARARAVLKALTDLDIFVRMPFVAPEDRCIRISCAPESELDILAERLPAALANAIPDRM